MIAVSDSTKARWYAGNNMGKWWKRGASRVVSEVAEEGSFGFGDATLEGCVPECILCEVIIGQRC